MAMPASTSAPNANQARNDGRPGKTQRRPTTSGTTRATGPATTKRHAVRTAQAAQVAAADQGRGESSVAVARRHARRHCSRSGRSGHLWGNAGLRAMPALMQGAFRRRRRAGSRAHTTRTTANPPPTTRISLNDPSAGNCNVTTVGAH